MHANLFRIPFRPPLAPPVFEISHQFLLLGINRDHRLIESDVAPDFAIDVLELSIAVRMRVSFLGLPVGLQAVPQIMQQLRDHWIAHPMSHPVEALRSSASLRTLLQVQRKQVSSTCTDSGTKQTPPRCARPA